MKFKIGDTIRIKKRLPKDFNEIGIPNRCRYWSKKGAIGKIIHQSDNHLYVEIDGMEWWIDANIAIKIKDGETNVE